MLSRRLITSSSRVLMRSSLVKTLPNQINSSFYYNSQIYIPQRQFSGMFTGIFEKLTKAYDVFKNGSKKTGEAMKQQMNRKKITREESLKILDLDSLPEFELTPEKVQEKFEKFFNSNDPKKGGSFYLQSKIYRAHEYLVDEFIQQGRMQVD